MAIININTDALRDVATRLDQAATAIGETLAAIQREGGSLSGVWEGQASAAAQEAFGNLPRLTQRAQEGCGRVARAARFYAGRFDDANTPIAGGAMGG
jgi:WXG100 family type VII secretion target